MGKRFTVYTSKDVLKTDYWIVAEFVSVWFGWKSWFRFRPERVCILDIRPAL